MSDSMLAIRRFAMRPGIELRHDYDAPRLRALAKATRNAGQSRRLLALAEIYEGGPRSKAARVGGVGLQTVRDWVVRFNAHGPEALIDGKAPGKAPGNACKLQACHRKAVLALVESGPVPAVHGVVRWRLKDLVQGLWDEVRIEVSETTLGRELRALGDRKLSARAIMPRARPRWRFLQRVSRASGGDRVERGRWQAARDLVGR
jgi:transposase